MEPQITHTTWCVWIHVHWREGNCSSHTFVFVFRKVFFVHMVKMILVVKEEKTCAPELRLGRAVRLPADWPKFKWGQGWGVLLSLVLKWTETLSLTQACTDYATKGWWGCTFLVWQRMQVAPASSPSASAPSHCIFFLNRNWIGCFDLLVLTRFYSINYLQLASDCMPSWKTTPT